jgi:hypothetical protein
MKMKQKTGPLSVVEIWKGRRSIASALSYAIWIPKEFPSKIDFF